MERLYLIRCGMERFLGPFTLSQVRAAYGRMEFGLQDEISGNLRPWVSFDDLENIRRIYPEMVQLVQREMLSGWGVSSHAHGTGHQTKIKKVPDIFSQFSLSKAFLVAFMSGFGVILAILYKDGILFDLPNFFRDRNFFIARTLYGDSYNARFEAFMDRNRDAINLAMKRKKGLNQWLPFVRAVAFERDGRWEGLHPSRLRTKQEEGLPADCSLVSWQQRWRSSRGEWSAFLDGAVLPRADWALILTLDPHWVRARMPVAGWLEPGSYAEGCLLMANKALAMPEFSQSNEKKSLLARLGWQLGFISRARDNENFEMEGSLWSLSCIEDGRDDTTLKSCTSAIRFNDSWKDFLDLTVLQRRLALLIESKAKLDANELRRMDEMLQSWRAKKTKPFIDYGVELSFYQAILDEQGDIRKAEEKVQQKFSNVRWTH